MADLKCPVCGSQSFYAKDEDDEYEIYEFELSSGEVCFSDSEEPTDFPEIMDKTETFCNRCAWHGPFKTLDRVA